VRRAGAFSSRKDDAVKTFAIVAAETGVPEAGAGDTTQQQGSPYTMFIMMGLIFVVFYFLLIRPQRKKEKDRQAQRLEMLKALKKSDHIMTIGGIHGIVASVGEDEVTIKVDEKADVRIRMSRDAISKVIGAAEESGGEKKLGDGPETNN